MSGIIKQNDFPEIYTFGGCRRIVDHPAGGDGNDGWVTIHQFTAYRQTAYHIAFWLKIDGVHAPKKVAGHQANAQQEQEMVFIGVTVWHGWIFLVDLQPFDVYAHGR